MPAHTDPRIVIALTETIQKLQRKSGYIYHGHLIYIIKGVMFVCLFVSMFRMAGQTAERIETKLDTRTHVHPGSVSATGAHS